MPVVAVAVAASSFAAGATAFAAATTMGSMIAAGAAMAGSALAIVGTATGNKKLSMLGGVLTLGAGLSGGLGGGGVFGGSEGAAEAAASNAAETSTAGLEGGAAINEASHFSDAAFDAGMPNAATQMSAPAASSGLIDMQPTNIARPMTDVQSQAAVDAASTASDSSGMMNLDASTPFSTLKGAALNAGATQVGQSTSMNAFDPEMTKLLRQQNIAQQTQGGLLNTNLPTVNAGGGYFDSLGRWVKENPELAKIGGQAISGIAGNLVPSDKAKAETELARQQVEALRRRALWGSGRI